MLNIISWVILAGYLGFSIWFSGERMDSLTFKAVDITIADSLDSDFVSPVEVTETIAAKGIRIKGNRLSELNRDEVRKVIKTLPGVKDALVYSTPDGVLYVTVWQRIPVMRYINPAASFYIDSDGREMPLSDRYTARVLTVTGDGNRQFLQDSLFPVVTTIRSEPFLEALVSEIAVNDDHTLEIVPRVGDHRIFFGDVTNHEWKLVKLKAFYEKGLPNTGWGRYSNIDLRYSNQVVARLWSKEERIVRDSIRLAADTTAMRIKQEAAAAKLKAKTKTRTAPVAAKPAVKKK